MDTNLQTESFVRNTADFVLRQLFIKLGDNLSEDAFIEVYVAWSHNIFSKIPVLSNLILYYEILKVCHRYKQSYQQKRSHAFCGMTSLLFFKNFNQ